MLWIKLEIKQRRNWAAATLISASVICGGAMAQTAPSLEDPLAALQREIAQTAVETPAVETPAAAPDAGLGGESGGASVATAFITVAAPMDAPPPRRTLESPVEFATPLAGIASQTQMWAATVGLPSVTLTFALAIVAALAVGVLAAAFTHRAPAAARPKASGRPQEQRSAQASNSSPAGPNLERLKQSIRDDWPRSQAEGASAAQRAPSAFEVLTQAADRSADIEAPLAAPDSHGASTAAQDAISRALFETPEQPPAPDSAAASAQADPLSSALQRLSELKRRARPHTPPPQSAEDAASDEEAFDAVMRLLIEDDDAPLTRPTPRRAELEPMAAADSGSAASVLRRAQSGSMREPAE